MLIHSNSIACIAGSIVGAYEIKFWQGIWQEILPRLPENLAILNAAHFYDLIDFSWSQLNQPIRTVNFRARRLYNTLLLLHAWQITENLGRQIRLKPVKGRKPTDENANDFCRLSRQSEDKTH